MEFGSRPLAWLFRFFWLSKEKTRSPCPWFWGSWQFSRLLRIIGKKNETKVHSFCKQCLPNLHFVKTRYFSWNPSISCNIRVPCFENEWILDLIYFLFDTNFKGIFTGPPPDFKPARNKKYPYYTPLRNANIFSDRQHLSFERKRVIVAVEKRKKAHALLMRYGNTGCGVFKSKAKNQL